MDASARDSAFQVSRLHERENRFERRDKHGVPLIDNIPPNLAI